MAGAGIGGHIGILVVWVLNAQLGLDLGDAEVGAVVALCGFVGGYLVKE